MSTKTATAPKGNVAARPTQLTLDITPGRGSSFSLEIPLGVRFFIRSRIFSENELIELNVLNADIPDSEVDNIVKIK